MESYLTMGNLFAILFLLVLMQIAGTWLQVKAYRQAVKRLHKKGNLGIGALRRRFGPSNIVIIACNRDGIVTGGEVMSGMTIFTRFREIEGITGKSLAELKEAYQNLPKRRRKAYKGHLQAVEVLEARLNGSEEVTA